MPQVVDRMVVGYGFRIKGLGDVLSEHVWQGCTERALNE